MARLTWDDAGSRFYEYGVDHGVLYVENNDRGVVWNGLIDVTTTPKASEPEEFYLDGFKYYTHVLPNEFGATIEAYTYPEEFSSCEGYDEDPYGIEYSSQGRSTFGLSYRTMIGDDLSGPSKGYKIHLIYNALATPSDRSNSTVSDSQNPIVFSWDLITTPISIPNKLPTAHIVLDSRKLKSDTLRYVENILYGTSNTTSRLPSPQELSNIVSDWAGFRILPQTSGIALLSPEGSDDLSGNQDVGIFSKPSGSRLNPTSDSGVYRLD